MARFLRIAARVAAPLENLPREGFTYPVQSPRTPAEEKLGSGMPGDGHVNPEPYKGMGLSTNPHPKISPQTMPETICRPYVPNRKLTHYSSDSDYSPYMEESSSSRHHEQHSSSLRKIAERDWDSK